MIRFGGPVLPLVLLVGCGNPVGVSRPGVDTVYSQIIGNVLTTGNLSSSTVDVLRRYGLDEEFDSEPSQALERLYRIVLDERDAGILVALAELCYQAGEDEVEDERDLFLSAAVIAYIALLDPGLAGPLDGFDPRFRMACDLYNRSLVRAFRQEDGTLSARQTRWKVLGASMTIQKDRSQFRWEEGDFDQFLAADEFEVRGLANRYREPGLGVALIAVHTDRESLLPKPGEYFTKPSTAAATGFLRIDGGLDTLKTGQLTATLQLISPLDRTHVEIGDRIVPLEFDLTAPIALSLETSRIYDREFSGFFGSDDEEDYTGLYLMLPYDPKKIPVVFVHGTASSPARWADLFNDIRSEREFTKHYQFWYFTYLTGQPVGISANDLRQSLHSARRQLDPEGDDRAFDQMVIVGHSQGGLLTRHMVVKDVGQKLWNSIFNRPIDELDLDPDTRQLLEEVLFFDPVPFVRRTIYLATPHRGSVLSDGLIGGLANSLITAPRKVSGTLTGLIQRNEDALARREFSSDVPTAVGGMSPTNPYLLTLAELPATDRVEQHSIIAVDGDGDPEEGSDGVVAYTSAHLDGVVSELVVRGGHSCQENPLAILEVRRILREHLRAQK